MKLEFKIIADLLEENTRILDVGCDDGTLMEFLKKNKNLDIRGIEISKKKVQVCISKGLTVLEGNAEFDLTVKVGKNEPRVNVVDHAELQEYVDPMVYCEDDGTYSPTK